MKIGILASHPIQYQAPLFQALAAEVDLEVFYQHRQTGRDQARAGYGVEFEWDVDLLSGYAYRFLQSRTKDPNVHSFWGCDTPEIAGMIRTGRFDAFLVLGWHLRPYWQAIRACRRHGVPVLVRGDSQLNTKRSLPLRAAKEIVYRWVMRQFDGFLYVGKRNLAYLRHYGAPREKCFFAPHFVDSGRFKQQSALTAGERQGVRFALGALGGELLVLSVGRLVDMKRPLDVIRAAYILQSTGLAARVAFVGAGPLEGEIRSKAQALDVPVTLAGFRNQSELPRIYAAADLFVLTSCAQETWGLVVNEAMACGLPAVVSDAAGCSEDLIVSGKTGEIYPMGNVPRLATAIAKAAGMRKTPESQAELEKTVSLYSLETSLEGIREAVSSVMKGHRSHGE